MRYIFLILSLSIFLNGCQSSDYKLMSKEDRRKMIAMSMYEGYQIGKTDCSDVLPQVTDFHLRDLKEN